jgi:uncharacterized Zn ribbon protein
MRCPICDAEEESIYDDGTQLYCDCCGWKSNSFLTVDDDDDDWDDDEGDGDDLD